MPISYLGHYGDNQNVLSKLAGLEQKIIIIGGDTNGISQVLPTLAKGNDVAMMIGGIKSDVGNVLTKVNLINQQIPTLAKGNDVVILVGGARDSANNAAAQAAAATSAAVSAGAQAAAATSAAVSAGAQATKAITAGDNAGAQGANAAAQAAAAAATAKSARTEQSNRFNNVDSSLSSLQSQLSGLTSFNGSAASVVSITTSQIVVPYTANSPERDLIYVLGAGDGGYLPVSPAVVEVVANSTEGGLIDAVLDRSTSTGWYSTNTSGRNLTFDFGKNKTTRNILLTGLGFNSFDGGGVFAPVSLVISGSNNNSSYSTVFTWSNIGFNADAQWRFTVFGNSTAYRYIRIAQSGLNRGGNNYFSTREISFFGTINNP